jgi:hypothetical protein
MSKTLFVILLLLTPCVPTFAQDASYYKAIQKGSSSQIQPAEFKKLEQKALKDYSKPDSYELLATSFGGTTEKVWAVIYGEVYCNLATDSADIDRIGALVYQWYEKSLSKTAKGLSADLTESAQGAKSQVPFESQFEMSFLMGASFTKDAVPLTIQKLAAIRKTQLALWGQKKLPETALMRRQEAILSAGHLDAYNYWLFKGARPEEFKDWLKEHQTQYQAWLDWQGKNKFDIQSPDFQRLHLLGL